MLNRISLQRQTHAAARRWLNVALLGCTAGASLASTTAMAFSGELGPIEYKLSNIMSFGAAMRMQDRNTDFIGRTNLPGQESYCQASAADPVGTCVVSGHEQYLAGRGLMGNNTDNGNMNFDQHDLTFGLAKFTSDLEINWGNSGAFFRFFAFKDWSHEGRKEQHWNTTFQPAETDLLFSQEEDLVANGELVDAYVYHDIDLFDRTLSIKAGRQVISWGESLINVINSFNVISPPDAVKVRYPGLNLKEIFRPVEAIDINMDITDDFSAEMFYQLKWNNVHIDPQGAFHSLADAAEAGGDYVMIDFGKGAEDPDSLNDDRTSFSDPVNFENTGRGCINPDTIGSATHPYGYSHRGGTLGRTACREPDITPRDSGQWGLALRYYASWLNDTDIGFYYMNYHSRLPYGSPRASINGVDLQASAGSIPGGAELLTAIDAATAALPIPGNLSLATAEIAGALMVADTVTIALEYPEDIEVYGFSFNTTFGDISVSAEYAHRPNLPVQIGGADLIYYALAPAFGDRRRSAIPSQVETYRYGPEGREPNPGEIIHGYERLEVGQGDVVSIWATSNAPLFADQWIVIVEAGFTKVYDLPGRDELTFDGPNTQTHQSQGRDEAEAAFAENPNDPDQTLPLLVLNPQRQVEGWATSFSWGYKFLSILDYPNVFGFNVKQITGFFHDVNGIGPSPAPTYVEDSKEILFGLDLIKGPWLSELRYKVHTGGGSQNPDRDRDELSLAVKYHF